MKKFISPLAFCAFAFFAVFILFPAYSFAQETIDATAEPQVRSFTDLPSDHFAFTAVEFLYGQGIISGYEDKTFRPNAPVNRAEAIKIIIAPLVSADQIAQAVQATTVYSDVDQSAWYKPFVELARVSGVIDGPPAKTNFNGTDTVMKAEFIKMVEEAFGVGPKEAFSEIQLPLSNDVVDVSAWHYPYMRFAIASSMTMINPNGTLEPGRELTRAETALLLYRFIMFNQGRRTQALLSETENEIFITLRLLDQGNLPEAEYSSARALLAARGAHLTQPDEPIVQGAVKISESFRSLVRAYRAVIAKDLDEVIRLAGESWNQAARGKELSPDIEQLSEQVQRIAKDLADSARAAKAQSAM